MAHLTPASYNPLTFTVRRLNGTSLNHWVYQIMFTDSKCHALYLTQEDADALVGALQNRRSGKDRRK